MRYTRLAGVRLSQRIQEIADQQEATISLAEELTLARALIDDALELRAKLEANEKLTDEKRLAALVAVNERIVAHLRQIEALATAAAKLEAMAALDARTLQAVVLQVAELVDSELRDLHFETAGAIDVQAVAVRLTDRIQNDIVVPSHEEALVQKLPSGKLVDQMDNTVPETDENA